MKTFLVFFFCMFLLNVQKVCAGDTLLVVTSQGTYILESGVQNRLSPASSDFSDNVFFSTEGLSHLVHLSDREIRYSFQRKNRNGISFDWWSLSVTGAFSGEVVNFDTKPENSGYIMYPLCWSPDSSSIYFFSTNQDALNNERGIFRYDCVQKKITEIIPADSYVGLPLVNDERTACYFLRQSFAGQKLMKFNFATGTEEVLLFHSRIVRVGIVSRHAQSSGERGGVCAIDFDQPELKSPFNPLVQFCVTRMGFDDVLVCAEACPYQSNLCSPVPYCEGHCQAGCANCRDAVDMDVLIDNSSNRIIVASADGYVVRAQSTCPIQGMGQGYGFGYHAVIRHGDANNQTAPETLYAHMSELFVEEGQFVYSGQWIGVLGDSQVNDCNSDGVLDCECESEEGAHVHFEYHSGSGGLYSTTDIFAPIFVDIGDCVMQPNNSYTPNWEGMDDVIPDAGNYEIVDIDIVCGGHTKVTIVGEVCPCCESTWYPYNNSYSVVGDTVVVFVTENQVNNTCYFFGQTVVSPCISTNSVTDAILICLTGEDFAQCVFGCMDQNACNFNPSATYTNNTVCDFSCLTPCELADTNQDNEVNIADILSVIGSIGNPDGGGDVNNDGVVGVMDLEIVFSYFGETCE